MSGGFDPAVQDALSFTLDRDSDIQLRCPDCGCLLWLDSDDAPTLGHVVKVAAAHECTDPDDGAPAVVTAGTEHLVAELAEEGR